MVGKIDWKDFVKYKNFKKIKNLRKKKQLHLRHIKFLNIENVKTFLHNFQNQLLCT